jgi:hypothetical protein
MSASVIQLSGSFVPLAAISAASAQRANVFSVSTARASRGYIRSTFAPSIALPDLSHRNA